MKSYFFLWLSFLHVSANPFQNENDNKQIRMPRSLEDELKELPFDNRDKQLSFGGGITASSAVLNLENPTYFPHKNEDFAPSSGLINPTDGNHESYSSPAATEYMVTTTATPQIPNVESGKISSSSTPNNDEDNDDDDDEDDDDEGAADGKSETDESSSSTVQPAYVKDVYFSATEEKPANNLGHESGFKPLTEAIESDGSLSDVIESDANFDQQIEDAVMRLEDERTKKDFDEQRMRENESLKQPEGKVGTAGSFKPEKSKDQVKEYAKPLEKEVRNESLDTTENVGKQMQFQISTSFSPQNDEEDDDDDDDEADSLESLTESENTSSARIVDAIPSLHNDDSVNQQTTELKNEIVSKLNSIGFDRKLVDKKSTEQIRPKTSLKAQKVRESSNEEILELMVKVAEDPKDWEEIRELLEKIQYEETTMKKAKARVKALAKQQLKNRKDNKSKGKSDHKHGKTVKNGNLENQVLPKIEKITSLKSSHKNTPNNNNRHRQDYFSTSGKGSKHSKGSVFQNSYQSFPKEQEKASKYGNHRHGGRDMDDIDDDFAIEKPVTVIGERSRIDPVEKELLEASTNERLREIQKEKARLVAISQPTDEMEEQLKALTKLERRLKEHWRQKQKLMEKIREKNQHRHEEIGNGKW